MPELVGLTIADSPEAWAEIGFAVADGAFALGGVRIALAGRERGEGIVDWELGPKADAPAVQHPNRALALDHVVLRTPYYERTRDALVAAGLDLRRERDDVRNARMAFFRVGPAVLELVGAPAGNEPGPPARRRPARAPHRDPARHAGHLDRGRVHDPARLVT